MKLNNISQAMHSNFFHTDAKWSLDIFIEEMWHLSALTQKKPNKSLKHRSSREKRGLQRILADDRRLARRYV